MRSKKRLNRQLLIYIGLCGAIFIALYSVIIANYFIFGLELHSKVIFENEAKNYYAQYKVNKNTPLPENSTLRSYRSLIDVPEVLLALHSESVYEHGPLKMGHGEMKIFERGDFDKYDDAFNVDSLCFNELCETVFFYSYNIDGDEWLYMVMGLPDTETDKLHNTEFDNAAKVLMLIAFLFFLTVLALAFLLSKKIIQPMTRLAYWAENLEFEHLKGEIPDLEFEELDIIASQLKSTFIRLDNVLANEKLFLSSASHELRTPIAVLTTNLAVLEALLQQYSADSKELQVLSRVIRAVENMKQLTQTLLWLNKGIDDFPPATAVNLQILLEQVIDECSYLLNSKNVNISIENKGANEIKAPEVLCKIIITNLIRNAFQYTQNGLVEITLENNSVEIINLCESAELILDKDVVEHSFGIGLQLVERITNKLHWAFKSSELNNGRIVSIDFSEQNHD